MFNFRWFLVDDCITSHCQIFETPLSAETEQEAKEALRSEWDSLSQADKDRRDGMYVVKAGVDSEGGLDWNFVIDVLSIKRLQEVV